MTDCLFCQIAKGEMAQLLYSDDQVLAFRDINPQAPTHVLIIPRKHIATINDASDDDGALLGQMVIAAKHLAKDLNIAESGYRLVFNCNDHGGQEVFHIHLHLLAGRAMQWPPG